MNSSTAAEVARMLLQIRAIKLSVENPFTWASGWKSPIYCDNRLALSYPDVRTYIKERISEAVQLNFPATECIGGVATAGIPQGVLVADRLGLPFVYVRPKPKEHGLTNSIEGKVVTGQKIVVIEDLVSTGGSSLKAAESLSSAGFEVLGMISIFTYGFPVATENFKTRNLPLIALCDYAQLIETALSLNYIDENQLEHLGKWRVAPELWH